jgi:hypothetical protein
LANYAKKISEFNLKCAPFFSFKKYAKRKKKFFPSLAKESAIPIVKYLNRSENITSKITLNLHKNKPNHSPNIEHKNIVKTLEVG